MKRFIRWQGIIAFIVLGALLVITLYFFAETLAKSALISSAESAFGAEVNIEAVELNYSPLQISVIGLQVTDKDQPSHNVFSFERATAGADVWQYLFGKIIVEQLDVSKLAFSSIRAQVGQVYKNEESLDGDAESLSDKAKSMLPAMDMKLPDVNSLLNDSNLLTVKAGEDLKAVYEEEQIKLTELKAQLPTKEKLEYYQDKVKALGKLNVKSLDDIEKIKKEYESIKAEFKADQALVKNAKKQVIASKKLLAKHVSEVKSGPARDWQQIEKKYQLESIDTEDFAHIIFGEQAREYFQKAQWVYEKVAPFMENMNSDKGEDNKNNYDKGRFVYFKEDTPLPSVLIKKALFSLKLEQGDFVIKGSELTHQHWIRGQNSLLDITSISNGEIELNSEFKLTKSGQFISDGSWTVNNRALEKMSLTKSKALTLSIDKAMLDGNGDFTLIGGDIRADNHLLFGQTSYQGTASTKMTSILLDTMQSLDKLSLDIGVNGKLSKPNISIGSSLNDALTGAFKKQVTGKVDEFKGKVNKGLNDKLLSSLKLGDSQNAELLNLEALLTDTDKALDDLKNSDVVKQQKKKLEDKLKNKAKDKLKNKLGNLFG